MLAEERGLVPEEGGVLTGWVVWTGVRGEWWVVWVSEEGGWGGRWRGVFR